MKILLALLLIAGSYPDSQLKGWFDSLKSGKGLCCSFADGRTVATDDWGIKGAHYWVIVDGQKIVVPDDALISASNRLGQAIVWPYEYEGQLAIRCFIPGAET
jgi:hypothetical protein